MTSELESDARLAHGRPRLEITPSPALADELPGVRVVGLEPGEPVTLRASMADDHKQIWRSWATFTADAQGVVDVSRQAVLDGNYAGIDPAGLFWSMQPTAPDMEADLFAGDSLTPLCMHFEAQAGDALLAATILERRYLASYVKNRAVQEDGLVGTLFLPAADGPLPGLLMLGGSAGGLKADWAALLAAHGFATLALAYFGCPSLPSQLANIPLEYFEAAIAWLQGQPQVQSDRLAVVGGSRGGELALLLGATFPTLRAVVAYLPGSHLFWGFGPEVAPGTPTWTHHGQPLPFLHDLAETRDPARLAETAIPAERCQGPILLNSGQDDQLWPSAMMGDLVCQRLAAHQYPYRFEHHAYSGAGHMIGIPYLPATVTESRHPVSGQIDRLGGRPPDTAHASADAWPRMLRFLAEALKA